MTTLWRAARTRPIHRRRNG